MPKSENTLIDYCTKHPEAKSFYYDSKENIHLCTECVMAWFDENKTRNCHRDNTFGRITYICPDLQMKVGNFESGKDVKPNQVIFNVSDSYTQTANYWFPINEISAWGYAPFYWFKKLADNHRHENKLVHCHAGIHRSLMMGYCWGLSLGYSHSQLTKMFSASAATRDYHRDIKKGHIPDDLPKFYEIMDKYPDFSLSGCLRELGIPQLLNNTSLRETTKYQDYINHTNKNPDI